MYSSAHKFENIRLSQDYNKGNITMAFASKRSGRKSKKRPRCSAVIVAAGMSQRMDGEDKLFLEILGAPVLAYSLTAFQNCTCIDEIVIVAREESLGRVSELCRNYGVSKAANVITGGTTRLESVMNGLLAVSKKTELAAIHDGARPCVTDAVIARTVGEAMEFYAAAPGIPVRSTLKRVGGRVIVETVDRDDLYEIQTPQVFDADLIKAALASAIKKGVEATDDCMAVEMLGVPVHITEGSPYNIKITTKEDIAIAEAMLNIIGKGNGAL